MDACTSPLEMSRTRLELEMWTMGLELQACMMESSWAQAEPSWAEEAVTGLTLPCEWQPLVFCSISLR